MSDRAFRLTLILLMLVAAMQVISCAAPKQVPRRPGPDAQVSRLPEAATDERWPSDSLRFVIARPSYDQGTGSQPSIDPRTTLAVLDPERATWIMAGRMDDTQGLELTDMLQQLVLMETLQHTAPVKDQPMEATLAIQPEGNASTRTLSGGQWRVRQVHTATDHRSASSIVLAIQDDQGRIAGEAEMDLSTARDLILRLSSAVRAPRP